MSIQIGELEFIKTCDVCPEQYDVKDKDGRQVGYIRLRWGELRCDFPDCGGETIYSCNFDDDFAGCFNSEEERLIYLGEIAKSINTKLSSEKVRVSKRHTEL